MNAKVTLHLNQEVIKRAEEFAAKNNVSLSQLTEFLYYQITTSNYDTLEKFSTADWVTKVAEGEATYKRRSRQQTKQEYYQRSR